MIGTERVCGTDIIIREREREREFSWVLRNNKNNFIIISHIAVSIYGSVCNVCVCKSVCDMCAWKCVCMQICVRLEVRVIILCVHHTIKQKQLIA